MKSLDKLVALAPAIGAMHHPAARDMQQKLNDVIDELRVQILPDAHYFEAWQRVALTLGDVRPQWRDEATGPSAVDSAVAAIRSMAAQCSAQPAPAIPIAWPEPVTREQLDALVWAQGYLLAKGYNRVVESLAQIETWLRKHGCDQIR